MDHHKKKNWMSLSIKHAPSDGPWLERIQSRADQRQCNSSNGHQSAHAPGPQCSSRSNRTSLHLLPAPVSFPWSSKWVVSWLVLAPCEALSTSCVPCQVLLQGERTVQWVRGRSGLAPLHYARTCQDGDCRIWQWSPVWHLPRQRWPWVCLIKTCVAWYEYRLWLALWKRRAWLSLISSSKSCFHQFWDGW